MKAILRLLLSVLFLLTAIGAKAAITITINTPAPTVVYQKTVSINVTVTSTPYLIDTVRATIGNKSALLVRSTNGAPYTGIIDLTGLPQGTLQISILAKDNMGNTQTKTQDFTYNLPPIVTVISPVKNAAFLNDPMVHIKATVNDPGSINCKGRVKYEGVILNFTNSIDTVVNLFRSGASEYGKIEFKATDSLFQTDVSLVPVYFEKSQFLKPFFTNTGEVIDFKGDRALILEKDNEQGGIPHLKIVNVLTNATEVIELGNTVNADTFRDYGILCEGGAVLALSYSKSRPDLTDSVYVWKNGTLNNISRKDRAVTEGIKSEGKFLMTERSNGDLIVTDLTNLSEVTYMTDILNNGNDLSKQGVVAYSKRGGNPPYSIQKYDANTGVNTTVVTTSGFNIYPEIDGNNIVYAHYDQVNGPVSSHFNNGTTDEVLGALIYNNKPYQLNDGYVAYSKRDNSNIVQCWLRTPAGVNKQITFYATSTGLIKLGDHGRMLLASSNNETLYTDSITPLKPVSSHIGTIYFNNNDFYMALGGSIFKYDILSGPAAVITSISPTSAGKGETVTITGERFTAATGVTFGTIPAQSYTIVSDTQIKAVVDTGATGSVVVQMPAGNGTITGFKYLPPPQITSVSSLAGAEQKLITINGANLASTTAVSFGGVPAASFTLSTSRILYARVGAGATGDIKVTTPYGEATLPGFKFIPKPTIASNGKSFLQGDTITFKATAQPGTYTYQWTRNNNDIAGATAATYYATAEGSYAVKLVLNGVSASSDAISITRTFSLPENNYKITNTSVTCRGANNGSINVTTLPLYSYSYTATITGSNNVNAAYNFNGSLDIKDLAAGTYNVCFTIASMPDYKQCFTSVITQPADLSVYTSVIKANNNVVLSLAGGDVYYVNLNGKTTETKAGQITLALKPGTNTISVNTDKACQGTVTKTINMEDYRAPYPNPFTDAVNIDLGDELVSQAAIRVYNSSSSKEVFNQQYSNRLGKINLSLKDLASGIYIVRLTVDNKETVYKVIKM